MTSEPAADPAVDPDVVMPVTTTVPCRVCRDTMPSCASSESAARTELGLCRALGSTPQDA